MIVNTAAIALNSIGSLEQVLRGSDAIAKVWQEGFGPSLVSLTTYSGYTVLLTAGHNRDGWEACVDHNGSQTGLPDGPEADASVYDVAVWAERIVRAYDQAHTVHSAFGEVYDRLVRALGAWHEVSPSDAEFLLDGDYPFQRSLEDVVAEVGAYVEALERRLLG